MISWFQRPGADSDVAISSRVRLARNFKKYPFPSGENEHAEDVIKLSKDALESFHLDFLRMSEEDGMTKSAMVARHLISPPFSKKESGALFKTPDESLCVMVNEEDHLRIQVMLPGNNLTEAYSVADKVDDKISSFSEYAYSEKLGYLTRCPTNLGTGLRASVMLHLPALEETGEVGKLMNMLSKLGITVRGTFGEATKVVGSIYQISNQVTLGIDESTSISNLSAIVSELCERERNMRRELYENNLSFQDKFYRSFAILQNARLISGEELYRHLSVLRIGITLGFLQPEKAAEMTNLLFSLSAGEIIKSEGREMTPEERDAVRSSKVRSSKLFN